MDAEAGRVTVRRSRVQVGHKVQETDTKTGRSRVVAVDEHTVRVLRRQSRQQLDDEDEWGRAPLGDGHVFAREDGAPWQPDRIRKPFDEAVKAAGVTRTRLQDLRHTHATIFMTLDTLSHVIPALQERAAELAAALVDGGS